MIHRTKDTRKYVIYINKLNSYACESTFRTLAPRVTEVEYPALKTALPVADPEPDIVAVNPPNELEIVNPNFKRKNINK